jgi:hypothetical protein
MADMKIDRRTLIARGAAGAALLVAGCARKKSRGFAAMSLRQLSARLERHIEPDVAPGMVGRRSGPEVETFVLGKMAFEGPEMRRDTIFRVASMSKRCADVTRPGTSHAGAHRSWPVGVFGGVARPIAHPMSVDRCSVGETFAGG